MNDGISAQTVSPLVVFRVSDVFQMMSCCCWTIDGNNNDDTSCWAFM